MLRSQGLHDFYFHERGAVFNLRRLLKVFKGNNQMKSLEALREETVVKYADDFWHHRFPMKGDYSIQAAVKHGWNQAVEAMKVPDNQRQRIISKLWELGFDCNRVIDESRINLIECLLITAKNRDDWQNQARVAQIETESLRKALAESESEGEK